MWIPSDINTSSVDANQTINTPTLVLVHGSGPHDHNEQIGEYATFRDLGKGLCEQYHIIVFTYDKRSCGPTANPPCLQNTPPFCELYTDPPSPCINITNISYNDFVADAISAVQFIATEFAYITAQNIIPVGHSQGASIVPWVADYMNLTTAISLMGTGIPIDEVIMYQLEASGQYNESQLAETQETFDMIMDGDFDDYDTVYILGVPATALFWKQWIDAGAELTRMTHLTQLNHILTLNSDTDWNVPPFAYEPLHEIIDEIAGNMYCFLYASMNVLPYMVHEMVYIDEISAGVLNVSQDVIDLVGRWSNDVVQMAAWSIPALCLNTSMSIAMETTTSTPTTTPFASMESTMETAATLTMTSIATTDSGKQEEHEGHPSHLFSIGISVGVGATVLCLLFVGVLLSRICGYVLCQKPGQIDTAYTVMDNERM